MASNWLRVYFLDSSQAQELQQPLEGPNVVMICVGQFQIEPQKVIGWQPDVSMLISSFR